LVKSKSLVLKNEAFFILSNKKTANCDCQRNTVLPASPRTTAGKSAAAKSTTESAATATAEAATTAAKSTAGTSSEAA
jgi:hypothetical protein